jgi:hypothetical protein
MDSMDLPDVNDSISRQAFLASSSLWAVSRLIYHHSLFVHSLAEVWIGDGRRSDHFNLIAKQIFQFSDEVKITICRSRRVFTEINDKVKVTLS